MSALDAKIDDLYRLPLSEFTGARNALAKTLKGDERKAFMKECLSGGAAPAAAAPSSAACDKSAADKKLHGAAAKSHVKKCMADATASAPK